MKINLTVKFVIAKIQILLILATTILPFSSKVTATGDPPGLRPSLLFVLRSNHRLQPYDESGRRNSNLTPPSKDTYI